VGRWEDGGQGSQTYFLFSKKFNENFSKTYRSFVPLPPIFPSSHITFNTNYTQKEFNRRP
jgi:hypothetical protein